jgi:hypothetical protein
VLDSDRGQLTVPPHCGLEIGDVVAYTDTHVAATQRTARVTSITTRFRRRPSPEGRRAVYHQVIGLGGV